MTITVKKITLAEQVQAPEGTLINENPFSIIGNLEVTCYVRLGTLTMTIDALRQLKEGQTLTLQQKTQEPVDIILNNQVLARGELMCSGEHFAIQIIELCS